MCPLQFVLDKDVFFQFSKGGLAVSWQRFEHCEHCLAISQQHQENNTYNHNKLVH